MNTQILHNIEYRNIFKTDSVLPYFTKLPHLDLLTIQQTKNTVRCCNVCRGQRIVAVNAPYRGEVTYVRCMKCNGAGVVHD